MTGAEHFSASSEAAAPTRPPGQRHNIGRGQYRARNVDRTVTISHHKCALIAYDTIMAYRVRHAGARAHDLSCPDDSSRETSSQHSPMCSPAAMQTHCALGAMALTTCRRLTLWRTRACTKRGSVSLELQSGRS